MLDANPFVIIFIIIILILILLIIYFFVPNFSTESKESKQSKESIKSNSQSNSQSENQRQQRKERKQRQKNQKSDNSDNKASNSKESNETSDSKESNETESTGPVFAQSSKNELNAKAKPKAKGKSKKKFFIKSTKLNDDESSKSNDDGLSKSNDDESSKSPQPITMCPMCKINIKWLIDQEVKCKNNHIIIRSMNFECPVCSVGASCTNSLPISYCKCRNGHKFARYSKEGTIAYKVKYVKVDEYETSRSKELQDEYEISPSLEIANKESDYKSMKFEKSEYETMKPDESNENSDKKSEYETMKPDESNKNSDKESEYKIMKSEGSKKESEYEIGKIDESKKESEYETEKIDESKKESEYETGKVDESKKESEYKTGKVDESKKESEYKTAKVDESLINTHQSSEYKIDNRELYDPQDEIIEIDREDFDEFTPIVLSDYMSSSSICITYSDEETSDTEETSIDIMDGWQHPPVIGKIPAMSSLASDNALINDEKTTPLDQLRTAESNSTISVLTNISQKIKQKLSHLGGQKTYIKDSKGEIECRRVFEKIYGKPFKKVWADFIKTPDTNRKLQLDGYNPELKIAFEYNGEYHYDFPHPHNANEEAFKRRKMLDALKVQKCKEADVKLIVIPRYYNGISHGKKLELKDIEAFIRKQLE